MSQIFENWLLINPETYTDEEKAKYLESVISKQSDILGLDSNLSNISYAEKERSTKFFKQVIDQPSRFTNDHKRTRRFLIDWYAAHKSLITKSRKILDLNILTNEELNELILGFGFPYPNYIVSKQRKVELLLNIINLYKKKGTPEALADILTLYGLNNIIISEWWILNNPTRSENYKFFARSKVIWPITAKNNNDYVIEKSYNEFIGNNPHWQLSLEQLKYYFQQIDPLTKKKKNIISLPSIAPVISVQSDTNLNDLQLVMAILQRKLQESYDFWLNYTLIPLNLKSIISNCSTPYFEDVVISPLLIRNTPPTIADMSSDPIKYAVTLVGTNPTGSFVGHERKLAFYQGTILDDDNNEINDYYFGEPIESFAFISHEDSEVSPNKILSYWYDHIEGSCEIIPNTGKWKIYDVPKDSIVTGSTYLTFQETSFIFNGTKWIDIGKKISPCKLNNLNENLFRDIVLNGFSETYSLLEVILGINYIFRKHLEKTREGIDGLPPLFTESENTDYLFFKYDSNNPDYPIFDEPSQIIDSTKACNDKIYIRDDIDKYYKSTNKYQSIIDEYNNLIYDSIRKENKYVSFRHFPHYDSSRNTPEWASDLQPKNIRDLKLSKFNKDYGKAVDYSINSTLYLQNNPEIFLEAINPTFLKDIDAALGDDALLLLESFLTDIEYYFIDILKILNVPFSYVLTGGEFYNKRVKPILEFFKPFRVKVLDFLTSLTIKNPVTDSLLFDDSEFNTSIDMTLVEKPFPRYFSERNLTNINDNIEEDPTGGIISQLEIQTGDAAPFDSMMMDHGLYTTDDMVLSIEEIIEEARYSPFEHEYLDRKNLLDLSINDVLTISIDFDDDGNYDSTSYVDDTEPVDFTFIEEILDATGDINYPTFITDEACIGRYTYDTDSSTININIYNTYSNPTSFILYVRKPGPVEDIIYSDYSPSVGTITYSMDRSTYDSNKLLGDIYIIITNDGNTVVLKNISDYIDQLLDYYDNL